MNRVSLIVTACIVLVFAAISTAQKVGQTQTGSASGSAAADSQPKKHKIPAPWKRESHFMFLRTNYASIGNIELRYKSTLESKMLAAQIGSARYAAIPAKINEQPIVNEDRIFVWHQILNEAVTERDIQIKDKFGDRTVRIGRAEWLVSTASGAIGTTNANRPSGQFYKAYRVIGGPGNAPLNQQVGISDGLGQENVTVNRPTWVCVPAQVWRDNTETKIEDENLILTSYLTTSSRRFNGQIYEVRNRFGQLNLAGQQPWGIMVPGKIVDDTD